jgi:4-amino-4-deoxy-L-arabinose transferase-like glycosyltransferase
VLRDVEGEAGARRERAAAWGFRAAVAALTAAAFLLRVHRLGAHELLVDEAYTFAQAVSPDWLRSLFIDENPPLYYLLMRWWVRLAGFTETALRAPSALFGALFIPACAAAGRTLFNRRVGLWCALAAAVSPLHVYYAQEARSYALLLLALLLAQLLAWESVRTGSRRLWLLATCCAVLALYTHTLAALGLLPLLFLPALQSPAELRRRNLRRLAATCAVCAAALLPWIWWDLFLRPHAAAGDDWIRPLWEATPPLLALPRSLETMGFGTASPVLLKQLQGLEPPRAVRLAGLAGLAVLGVLAAVPWGDRRLGVPDPGRRRAGLWLLLLTPLAVLWGASFVKPLYVVGRYDLVSYPAFVLLAGLGLAKAFAFRRLALPLGLAAVLAVATGTTLLRAARNPAVPDSAPTAAALGAGVRSGDVVVFTGLRGYPVRYYLARLGYACDRLRCHNPATGTSFAARDFPRETGEEAAAYNPARILASPDEARRDLEELLRLRATPASSLWLVFAGRVANGSLDVGDADWRLVEAIRERGTLPTPVSTELCLFRLP